MTGSGSRARSSADRSHTSVGIHTPGGYTQAVAAGCRAARRVPLTNRCALSRDCGWRQIAATRSKCFRAMYLLRRTYLSKALCACLRAIRRSPLRVVRFAWLPFVRPRAIRRSPLRVVRFAWLPFVRLRAIRRSPLRVVRFAWLPFVRPRAIGRSPLRA